MDDLSNIITADATLGITENIVTNENVKIYPNPAQQSFTIQLPQQQNFNLLVYDVTGRKVFQRTNSTGTVNIDCSGFTSGVYYVQVVNQRTVLTSKFVKE